MKGEGGGMMYDGRCMMYDGKCAKRKIGVNRRSRFGGGAECLAREKVA